MAFSVLIFEDVSGPRGLLRQCLEQILDSPHSNGSWPDDWPPPHEVEWKIEAVRTSEIKRLVESRSLKRLREEFDALFRDKKPDVIILDLAMTSAETGDLHNNGGRDETGNDKDPIPALKRTTGFRLLKCCAGRAVVVVSSYANNPRVIRACVDAGADAVITKPASDEKMNIYYTFKADEEMDVSDPAAAALVRNADEVREKANGYFSLMANEVRKAVKETALRRGRGHSPSPVPFWLAADRKLVDITPTANTNLMLIDIRGFSRLVELGKGHPDGVFLMLNTVWDVLVTTLKTHDAEVNNFIGDAALVFRGVYSQREAVIGDSIRCAEEICDLFAINGIVRRRLRAVIEQEYNTDRRRAAGQEMVTMIGTPAFGLRIIVAAPDRDEALYGRVGADVRWQHTILSRFMNWLARTETAVGVWEKADLVDLDAAHAFLLWPAEVPKPRVRGLRILPPEDFAANGELPDIRDVPKNMVVHKIVRSTRPKKG